MNPFALSTLVLLVGLFAWSMRRPRREPIQFCRVRITGNLGGGRYTAEVDSAHRRRWANEGPN